MTYGRSVFKAMDKFHLDTARWHELAAQRGQWRQMLCAGFAPVAYHPPSADTSTDPVTRATRPHEAGAALRARDSRGH